MLTKEMIKKVAMEAGADAVGFGDLNRFDGAPPDMDPRYIYPKAKSIIGFLFVCPGVCKEGLKKEHSFTSTRHWLMGNKRGICSHCIISGRQAYRGSRL